MGATVVVGGATVVVVVGVGATVVVGGADGTIGASGFCEGGTDGADAGVTLFAATVVVVVGGTLAVPTGVVVTVPRPEGVAVRSSLSRGFKTAE